MSTVQLNSELKKIATDAAINNQVAEEAQEKLLFFYQVATKSDGGFDSAAQRVQELSNQLEAANSLEPPADAPQQLLDEYDKLAKGISVAIDALEAATLFIQHRFPTMKQEDNLGVEVQINVHKKLEEYISICEGGKGGEEGGKGSFARFTSARSKFSYLKSRCELEKALKEKPAAADKKKDGDNNEDSAAAEATPAGPSNKYLLKQLDVDAARDISRTWSLLKKMGVQTTLMISRNFANLNQPRKESSGFIG